MKNKMRKDIKGILAFAMAVLLSLSPFGGMRWSVEKTHAAEATAADFFDYTVYTTSDRNEDALPPYIGDNEYYLTFTVKSGYEGYLGSTPITPSEPVRGSVLNTTGVSYPEIKLVDPLPINVSGVSDPSIKMNASDITALDTGMVITGANEIEVSFDAPMEEDYSGDGRTSSRSTNDNTRHWIYKIRDIDLLKAIGNISFTNTPIGSFSVSGGHIDSITPSDTGYQKDAMTFYSPIGTETYTLTIRPEDGYVLTGITGVDSDALQIEEDRYVVEIRSTTTSTINVTTGIVLDAPASSAIQGAYTNGEKKWYTSTGADTYRNVKKADGVPPAAYSDYDLQYVVSDNGTLEVSDTWYDMGTGLAVSTFYGTPNESGTKNLFLRYGNADRHGTASDAILIWIDNKNPDIYDFKINVEPKTTGGTNQYWGKDSVELSVQTRDNDSGLNKVQYAFTADATQPSETALEDAALDATGKATITYKKEDKNSYLYVKAVDNVGNAAWEHYSLSNIFFDQTNPAAMAELTEIKYYSTYVSEGSSSNVEISDPDTLAQWQKNGIYVVVKTEDPAGTGAYDDTTGSGIEKVELTDAGNILSEVPDDSGICVFRLGDGEHTITSIEAFDYAGNTTSTTLDRTIKIDKSGVTDVQVLLQPNRTAFKNSFDVTASAKSWSGIKEVTYVYYENGVEITDSKSVFTGTDIRDDGNMVYTVTAQAPINLLDQKKKLTVRVTFTDNCNREFGPFGSGEFSCNTKGSEIVFENTDSTWKTEDIEIPIHINDITGIDTVTISVNDTPVDAVRTSMTDTSAAYVLTLTENSPSTGTKVSVSAVNHAGDITVSEFLYRLDKQIPAVTFSGVADDSKNSTDQTLTIGINENNWNEMTVTAVASRTMDGTKHSIDLGTISAQSSSYAIEKSFSEEGIYDIQITAKDVAGNTDQKSIHFMIDKTAPIVDFKNKSNSWTNQNITVPIQVTEGLSDIRNVVITENGNTVTPTIVNETKAEKNYVFTLTNDSPETGTRIVVTATNEAGVTSTSEYIYRLDKQAPALNLSGVVNGNVYNLNQTVTVRAEDNIWADMKPVVITATRLLDGVTTEQDLGSFAMSSASTSNSRSFTEDGVYQVTATATDAAGNQTVQTLGFTLDKTAPVLSISGTPDGSYNGNPVTLSFAAIESFYETDNVTISVERLYEGSTYSSRVNFANTAKNSSVSNTFATDGEYTVVMTATDGAGNTATEQTLHFTVDVTAPAISVMGTKDYLVTKDKVSIQFSVTESYYETNQVRITGTRKDADGKQTNLNIEGWSNTGKTSSLSQEFTEDGYYTITIESTDRAGNKRAETIHFTIDTQAPVIAEMDQYNGKYLKKFVLEEALEDLIAELTSPTVKMTLNGSAYDGREITEDGKYTLIIEVTDEVGLTTTRTVEFIIDNTPPKVIFAGVQDGKTYTDPIRLNITLENENDTIDSITINNEQQDMQGKTSYDYAFNSFDDYIVTVYTSDEAGNTNSQTISFRYAEHTATSYLWIFIAAAVVATGLIVGLIVVGVRKKRG
ncbi:MAG: hypothetical protein IJ648_01340 [Lachnospiraceae bacterium]|nr:hypothetical protein [Lachnospiraceae bacterium]